jgi:hypothetical protein
MYTIIDPFPHPQGHVLKKPQLHEIKNNMKNLYKKQKDMKVQQGNLGNGKIPVGGETRKMWVDMIKTHYTLP